MQEEQETWVQSLGLEDRLEKEMAILQYSCLENSMDRGTWRAPVHGVAKNQTGMSMCVCAPRPTHRALCVLHT